MKNRYKIIAVIVTLFISTVLTAQTSKFQHVYGGYNYDYGNDLIQTSDSGYVLLCTSSSFSGSSDVYVLKIDKTGLYKWDRTYGGNQIEWASQFKPTRDTCLAIAGYSSSFGNGGYDFYFLKIKMNGDTIFSHTYGTTEWDFCYAMDTCTDGGYILAGKTYAIGNAYSDILVVKIDSVGTLQWKKTYGGAKDDVANSIITVNGGYVICGTSDSYGAGDNDIYVMKLNDNGDTLWTRTLGGPNDDEGNCVTKTFDGNYVISGAAKIPSQPNYYSTYIFKLKSNGTNAWNNANTSGTPLSKYITRVIQNQDSGLVIMGKYDVTGIGINDVLLYVNDSVGGLIYSATYGGYADDYGSNIINTNDKGYATIGTTNSFGIGLSNIYFVKSDSSIGNNLVPTISVGINDNIEDNYSYNIAYPNPFTNQTTIKIDVPLQKYTFTLIDELGQDVSGIVSTDVESNGKYSLIYINRNSLQSGIYFYNVKSGDKILSTGKIIAKTQ